MNHERVQTTHFSGLPARYGIVGNFADDRHPTVFRVFRPGGPPLHLPPEMNHVGFVQEGALELHRALPRIQQKFKLARGMYFACSEEAWLGDVNGVNGANGVAVVISSLHYRGGPFLIGGPLEPGEGRLKYIDGGSTDLLIPPPFKGAPCFNRLHFPAGHRQTRHKHPSPRFTNVFSGHGKCTVPSNDDGTGADVEIFLQPGDMFIIPTGGLHAIDAVGETPLDIVTYHPDSLVGWTHEFHPMLESTFIPGRHPKDALAA